MNLLSSGNCHPESFHGVPEAPFVLWEVRVISSASSALEEAATSSWWDLPFPWDEAKLGRLAPFFPLPTASCKLPLLSLM